MTASDKLREFAERIIRRYGRWWSPESVTEELLSDLTALISEDYVPKDQHGLVVATADKLLLENRRLKERCEQMDFMIKNGLGYEDMQNDITMPHEI